MAATLAEGVCEVCRTNKVDKIEDTCEVCVRQGLLALASCALRVRVWCVRASVLDTERDMVLLASERVTR